jgi:hypothetical protein
VPVDKLVPSGNATDTGAILASNTYTLIDETVDSADGSTNDSNQNDIRGNNAQWSLTSLTASIDTVSSSTFRVRARVLQPAGSDDTCTYRLRCTVNATTYDITYSDADSGSGFIDRTISVGTGFTEAQYNAATVQLEQTAWSKTKGNDNLEIEIDAFELEVDYSALAGDPFRGIAMTLIGAGG